ncbi:MAG: hypothetical protein NW208_07155 [Bryobacter sp.]|nr:hypothetical protein [Bryobacter sp.]
MPLKPQDIVVVLKIVAAGGVRLPYASMAMDLGMSTSEVHASVKRAQVSGLLHGPAMGEKPNLAALEEFLLHGLKYVFPAERGEWTRGVPTSYTAPPLMDLVTTAEEPMIVWPSATGEVRGVAFAPLHPNAPEAAQKDKALHELLAITDALRDGRIRERKIAESELRRLLKASNAPKRT